MTFVDILRSTRDNAVTALATRAALSNRLAKASESASSRRRLYGVKSAAISRLLALHAAEIEEVLTTRGLITVALPTGRRLHCPIKQLQPEARQLLSKRVLALCD